MWRTESRLNEGTLPPCMAAECCVGMQRKSTLSCGAPSRNPAHWDCFQKSVQSEISFRSCPWAVTLDLVSWLVKWRCGQVSSRSVWVSTPLALPLQLQNHCDSWMFHVIDPKTAASAALPLPRPGVDSGSPHASWAAVWASHSFCEPWFPHLWKWK